VRQAVIGDRVIVRRQVIGRVITEVRAAVALACLIMLQQAAFGVVTVIHRPAQGVADA